MREPVTRAVSFDDLDEIALSIVCVERVPMRLLGGDRVEALRRLTAAKVSAAEAARLLRCSPVMVARLRAVHHLPPAPPIQSEAWVRACLYGPEHAGNQRSHHRSANGEANER